MTPPIAPRSEEMRFVQSRPQREAREGSLVAPALGTEIGARRTFYVETYGCEMNDYDSEFIASRFLEEGYAPASEPESADVLLFNTCSIREGAEERASARISRFASLKRTHPERLIGVVGCMAQRLGEDLEVRTRGLVDLVAGTDTYRDLPEIVETKLAQRGRERKRKMVVTPVESENTYSIRRYATPAEGACANLTIMQGCDKFCTFCIVPFTRGRERSKPCADVVREATQLVERGAKQITLLGQNVNSYRDGDVTFDGLLRAVDRVEGLERVFFTSSYPRDMTEEVLRAVGELRTPIEYLHFPVQSGSDRVLKRMKRRHTVDWYVRQVDLARELIPDVHFSTDLIVGFPGETEEDFEATMDLIERVRYSECFMYRYSPREGTPATKLPDDLPEEVKAERLSRLIHRQREIGGEILQSQVGREMEVLVEGPSKLDPSELFGRTRNRLMVVLAEGSALPGDLVRAKLTELRGSTFRGKPVEGS